MGPKTQMGAGLAQSGSHVKIRHGGELHGSILQGGVLKANGARGHHHIPWLHSQIDAPAGPHPDEGVRADVVQLLHGNGRRGPANAGGADRDLFPQESAGVDIILPVHAHVNRLVKPLRNGLTPPRIPRQQTIAAHVPRNTMNVKLSTSILHVHHLFFT